MTLLQPQTSKRRSTITSDPTCMVQLFVSPNHGLSWVVLGEPYRGALPLLLGCSGDLLSRPSVGNRACMGIVSGLTKSTEHASTLGINIMRTQQSWGTINVKERSAILRIDLECYRVCVDIYVCVCIYIYMPVFTYHVTCVYTCSSVFLHVYLVCAQIPSRLPQDPLKIPSRGYVYVCVCGCVCLHVYVCGHVYVCVYLYVDVCSCICVYVCVFVYVFVYVCERYMYMQSCPLMSFQLTNVLTVAHMFLKPKVLIISFS